MIISYGRNFWAMSLGMFLFMVSFNLILPELNQYITMLGGQNQKGLIITLFTISAAISMTYMFLMKSTNAMILDGLYHIVGSTIAACVLFALGVC